jgi:hypothetical protein
VGIRILTSLTGRRTLTLSRLCSVTPYLTLHHPQSAWSGGQLRRTSRPRRRVAADADTFDELLDDRLVFTGSGRRRTGKASPGAAYPSIAVWDLLAAG